MKSNAVSAEGDESKDDSASDGGKKPGKNRKSNQKRKERMKAAMALLKEKEKAEKPPEESVPPSASSATGSSDSAKQKDFDPNSLSVGDLSKCIKLAAGLNMASNADASPSHDETAKEPSQASHGNVVKRLMGMLSDNHVDPAQVVSSSIKSNAVHSAVGNEGNASQGVYIPK